MHIKSALKELAPTFRRRGFHILPRAPGSAFWSCKLPRHLRKRKSFLGITFLAVFEANSEQIPAQTLDLNWNVDWQLTLTSWSQIHSNTNKEVVFGLGFRFSKVPLCFGTQTSLLGARDRTWQPLCRNIGANSLSADLMCIPCTKLGEWTLKKMQS